MSTTKAKQIADQLNAYWDGSPYGYKQIAEEKAEEINVGLYWLGTAGTAPETPTAEIWQINVKREWIRKLGEITLRHDKVWRA